MRERSSWCSFETCLGFSDGGGRMQIDWLIDQWMGRSSPNTEPEVPLLTTLPTKWACTLLYFSSAWLIRWFIRSHNQVQGSRVKHGLVFPATIWLDMIQPASARCISHAGKNKSNSSEYSNTSTSDFILFPVERGTYQNDRDPVLLSMVSLYSMSGIGIFLQQIVFIPATERDKWTYVLHVTRYIHTAELHPRWRIQ